MWKQLNLQQDRLPQRRGPGEHRSSLKQFRDLWLSSGEHHSSKGSSRDIAIYPWDSGPLLSTLGKRRNIGDRSHRCRHEHVRVPSFHCSCQYPPFKRRKSEVKAAVEKFSEQLSHQNTMVKKLQEQVKDLEEVVMSCKNENTAIKKKMLKVKTELKVLRQKYSHSNTSPDGRNGSSSGTGEGLSQLVSPSRSVVASNTSPHQESPLYRCPQMLTPISHTFCSTLQMLENLASSSSNKDSNSPSRSVPDVHQDVEKQRNCGRQKPPKAEALKPLKYGTQELSADHIDRASLFTAKQVLLMFEGCNIAIVASKLAEMAIFGVDVLKKCTPRGRSKYLALPQQELYKIKQLILDHTPEVWNDLESFEKIWNNQCMSRIAGCCSDARK